MKRRVLGVLTAAALSLATSVALASPALAASTCQTGTVPAVQASQSNFRAQCVLEPLDQSARVTLSDYPFARWHSGESRLVSANVNKTTGVLTGAAGTFLAGDLNHTVTANATNQACAGIAGRTFIKAQAGTTATLSVKPTKDTFANRTVTSASTVAGSVELRATGAGTSVFNACDVGRVITTSTGTAAGAKVATFVSTKLVLMSLASPVTSAAATRTLGPVNVTLQVSNTAARNVQDATVANGMTTLSSPTANFTPADTGDFVSGECIPNGTTMTQTSATTATLSVAANCYEGNRTFSASTTVNTTAVSGAGDFLQSDVGRKLTDSPAGTCLQKTHIATNGTRTSGLATISTATAFFDVNVDAGNPISGVGIPAGTTILSVTNSTNATMSANATASLVGTATFTITPPTTKIASVTNTTNIVTTTPAKATSGACSITVTPSANENDLSINLPDGATATARIVIDVTTNGSGVWSSPTANFLATDVGMHITKGAIKYLIPSVTSTTATTTPAGPLSLATPQTIQVGAPSGTAPVDGDLVAQQATSLQLLTSLVAGAPPCASGDIIGTTINGAWYNPGSFKTAAVLGSTASLTSVLPKVQLAEFVFPTSVVSFAAFLTPRPASAVDETGHTELQTAAHYDIVYPFEPLDLAVCPGTNVASDWTFVGTTLGQQSFPSGWGQPSTAVARGVQAVPTGVVGPQLAYVQSGPTPTDLTGTACTIDSAIVLTTLATSFPCGF